MQYTNTAPCSIMLATATKLCILPSDRYVTTVCSDTISVFQYAVLDLLHGCATVGFRSPSREEFHFLQAIWFSPNVSYFLKLFLFSARIISSWIVFTITVCFGSILLFLSSGTCHCLALFTNVCILHWYLLNTLHFRRIDIFVKYFDKCVRIPRHLKSNIFQSFWVQSFDDMCKNMCR